MRGDACADILGYTFCRRQRENACSSESASLQGWGAFSKVFHSEPVTCLSTGGTLHLQCDWEGNCSGEEDKERSLAEVKCWGQGQEIAPSK